MFVNAKSSTDFFVGTIAPRVAVGDTVLNGPAKKQNKNQKIEMQTNRQQLRRPGDTGGDVPRVRRIAEPPVRGIEAGAADQPARCSLVNMRSSIDMANDAGGRECGNGGRLVGGRDDVAGGVGGGDAGVGGAVRGVRGFSGSVPYVSLSSSISP